MSQDYDYHLERVGSQGMEDVVVIDGVPTATSLDGGSVPELLSVETNIRQASRSCFVVLCSCSLHTVYIPQSVLFAPCHNRILVYYERVLAPMHLSDEGLLQDVGITCA